MGDKSIEKPAADNAGNEYFNLKVKSQVNSLPYTEKHSFIYILQDGEEVFFKIKKSTQFKKLMDAFCARQQV